jgi:hypothetical protein
MGEGEKSKGRSSIVLIIVVVAIIIALWITVPNIPKAFEPEEEETESESYQQYDEFEGTSILVYKNQDLNVTLNRNYNPRRNTTGYEAHWVDIWGRPSSILERSPEALFDEILRKAVSLSTDQIKWFEYIIDDVVD